MKCLVFVISPLEWNILLCEIVKGCSEGAEIFNKTPIETCKTIARPLEWNILLCEIVKGCNFELGSHLPV
jgi:hypothetical protein